MTSRGAALGLAGLLWAALVWVGPSACTTIGSSGATPHASQTRRLPQIMRELEGLTHARLPQAMDLEQERTRRLYKVARVAAAIAESAAQLDPAESPTPLDAADQRAFAAQADSLERQARALAQNAHRLAPDAIRSRVAAIEATCTTCHQHFRPARVPLD